MNSTQISKQPPVSRAQRSPQTFSQPPKGMPMPASAVQSGPSFRTGAAKNYQAWVVKAAKQPMVLETVDLGPLGAEDVEGAVEHCGLCHTDLSVLNNDWCISQYPAILGHEVTGRITAIGPNTKGLAVGQRGGGGWVLGRGINCRPWMSGKPHPFAEGQATILCPPRRGAGPQPAAPAGGIPLSAE